MIAIDPGIWDLGWCIGTGLDLRALGVSRAKPDAGRNLGEVAQEHASRIRPVVAGVTPHEGHWVWVEKPEIRPDDTAKRSRDLVDVVVVGSMVAALLGRPMALPVSQWKGTIQKHIHHQRIVQVLSRDEALIVSGALAHIPKDNHKEALDALGMWLKMAGRIDKGGSRV